MKLRSQIVELDQELDKVLQGEGSAAAIVGLKSIQEKLDPVYEKLKSSLSRRTVLYGLPTKYRMKVNSTEEMEVLTKCFYLICSFEEKWMSLETKYSVIQDDVYSETLDVLVDLDRVIRARNTNDYNGWLSQMDSEVYVSNDQLEHQESIPALKDNSKKYREELQNYQKFRADSYVNVRVIGQLSARHKTLVKLKADMIFDQPESVVQLFKHLRQNRNNARAPLSMLTPEVLKWMSDHGEDQYFYVSDKRNRHQ